MRSRSAVWQLQAAFPRASLRIWTQAASSGRRGLVSGSLPVPSPRRRYVRRLTPFSSSAGGSVWPPGPARLTVFPVSLPTTRPRVFQAGHQVQRPLPSSRRRGGRQRREKPRLIATWSGIDLVTEYPVFWGSDDSGSDDAHDPDPFGPRAVADLAPGEGGTGEAAGVLVPASMAGDGRQVEAGREQGAARSLHAVLQDPWWLSGPLDRMTGLPIAVSKQTAVLLHACKRACPRCARGRRRC